MNLLTPLLARLFCYFRKHCLANLLEMTSSVYVIPTCSGRAKNFQPVYISNRY